MKKMIILMTLLCSSIILVACQGDSPTLKESKLSLKMDSESVSGQNEEVGVKSKNSLAEKSLLCPDLIGGEKEFLNLSEYEFYLANKNYPTSVAILIDEQLVRPGFGPALNCRAWVDVDSDLDGIDERPLSDTEPRFLCQGVVYSDLRDFARDFDAEGWGSSAIHLDGKPVRSGFGPAAQCESLREDVGPIPNLERPKASTESVFVPGGQIIRHESIKKQAYRCNNYAGWRCENTEFPTGNSVFPVSYKGGDVVELKYSTGGKRDIALRGRVGQPRAIGSECSRQWYYGFASNPRNCFLDLSYMGLIFCTFDVEVIHAVCD